MKTLFENTQIQGLLWILAIPVIAAILSFVCGLAARIPGLPLSIRLAIGRIFTSFEAEVTPANLLALQRRIVDLEANRISATALAVEVADRAVTLAIAALKPTIDHETTIVDTLPAPAPTGFVMAAAPIVVDSTK